MCHYESFTKNLTYGYRFRSDKPPGGAWYPPLGNHPEVIARIYFILSYLLFYGLVYHFYLSQSNLETKLHANRYVTRLYLLHDERHPVSEVRFYLVV